VLSTGTEYRHGGSNLLSQEVGATSIRKQSSAALQWDSSIDDQAAARLALLSNRERTAGARVQQLAKVQAEQKAAAVARMARNETPPSI
jgi:hypothetical protein